MAYLTGTYQDINMIGLQSLIGAAFMIFAVVLLCILIIMNQRHKKLTQLFGTGNNYMSNNQFDKLLEQIEKTNFEQKEMILALLFKRPIHIIKISDGQKYWLESILPFNPKEESLPPGEIDALLKKQTG